MEFTSYISGFVDGEGTFSVSFSFNSRLKTCVEVRPSFSISQHKRSKEILIKIKKYFGVGGIRFCKKDQNYKYEVRSINDLTKIIIPNFQKYPLMTQKKKDFEIFIDICNMMSKGLHLNSNYLFEIIEKAYLMNESGKRKYSKEKLLSLVIR
jgi:hypothetical protein